MTTSASRRITWPNGARCALGISWDVDVDSVLQLQHPDRGYDQYGALSFFRYDEVAIPNILERLAQLGVKATFFVPGWCAEQYPEMCGGIVAGGHEIASHGYMHEAPNSQTEEGELKWLRRARTALTEVAGRAPVGCRAAHAAPSQFTMEYLAAEGFLYDSSLANDHDPFVLDTKDGPLLELPCEVTMSDWPHYAHVPDMGYLMSPKAPKAAIEVFDAEFEATHELGGFLTTIWHPHVSGRPSRLMAWGEWVERILGRGDVWVAPLEEIARYLTRSIDQGEFVPRHVRWPFYSGPVAEAGEVGSTARVFTSGGWPK